MGLTIRISVALATMAAVLVPAMVSPARTISVPTTIARTVSSLERTGRIPVAFPPTHVIFSWKGDEDTGLEYRTIGTGGQRSEWMEVPEDEDAEHGDNHYSGALAVDRPVAVHWRRVVPKGARMGIVRLDYLNTMDGPRRKVRIPAVAQAAARTPDIVTRAQWGADESLKRTSGSCGRSFYRVQQLFVHHTAGTNFDRNPAATMRAIYHFHTRRRGWCDVGYNFVISHDGRIFEGRWARHYRPWEVHSSEDLDKRAVAGAHVASFNSGSVGISLMGNFTDVAPSPAARRALAELLAWEADRHKINPHGTHTFRSPASGATRRLRRIAGHRDAGHTACPGRRLYNRLGAIRNDTAAVIGEGKANSQIGLTVEPQAFDHGERTVLSGSLARRNGTPLEGRTVTIYERPNGRAWRTGAVLSTSSDGSFTASMDPRRITGYVAVFEGGPRIWGSQTRVMRAFVHHRVTVRTEGGTVNLGDTSHYPSGTTSVDIMGEIAPRHGDGQAVVAVLRQGDDGTFRRIVLERVDSDHSGSFRYTFRVPEPGTYRTNARYPKDAFHRRGFAGPVTFIVDP